MKGNGNCLIERVNWWHTAGGSFHGKANQEPNTWRHVHGNVLYITIKRKPWTLLCKKWLSITSRKKKLWELNLSD